MRYARQLPFGTLDLDHLLAFAVILCCPGLLRLLCLFSTLGTLGTLTQEVFRVPVLNRVSLDVKVFFATKQAVAFRVCNFTCTGNKVCLAVGAPGSEAERPREGLPVEVFQEEVRMNEPGCVRTAQITLQVD